MDHNESLHNVIFNYSSNKRCTFFVINAYTEELSDQKAMTLLPAIVVLAMVLLTGFVGNILVLYIYFTKFSSSSTRTAILALASFDLLTCALSIPGEILDLRFSYTFTSQLLCKGLRTTTTIVLIASGITLLSVALDRYQRICHPLHQQLTSKRAVYRVILSCVVASILAIPAAIVYGLASVETPQYQLCGFECSTSQFFVRHPLTIVYIVVLWVIFLAAFITMIVIYILIGRQVLKQTHFRNAVQKRRGSISSLRRHAVYSENSSDDHSFSDRTREISIIHDSIDENRKTEGSDLPAHKATNIIGRGETKLHRKKSIIKRLRRVSQSVDVRTRKTTLMLFSITIVFVVSFLPHVVLKAIQATNTEFVDSLSTSGTILYNIFVRSFFFNTAANAFVYGFCSPKFREECRILFFRLAFWMKRKTLHAEADDLL